MEVDIIIDENTLSDDGKISEIDFVKSVKSMAKLFIEQEINHRFMIGHYFTQAWILKIMNLCSF